MQSKPSKIVVHFTNLQQRLATPFLANLGNKYPILNYRTPFDRSQYSCIENIIRGFLQPFVLVYGFKAFVNLIFALLKFKVWQKDPKILLQALSKPDSLYLGLFVGSFTCIMKTVITLTRMYRKKDDGYNGLVAGMIAGWVSLFFLPKTGRTFLACFMLARAYECCYNHMVNQGMIKHRSWHFALLFVLGILLPGYGYGHETHLNNPSLNKFFEEMSCRHPNDNILIHLWTEMTRRRLVKSGIIKEPYLL